MPIITQLHPSQFEQNRTFDITVVGNNFVSSILLACHIGELTVAVTFHNSSVVSCAIPRLSMRTYNLSIANDGVHFFASSPFLSLGIEDNIIMGYNDSDR